MDFAVGGCVVIDKMQCGFHLNGLIGRLRKGSKIAEICRNWGKGAKS